jgi:hypothetical protein
MFERHEWNTKIIRIGKSHLKEGKISKDGAMHQSLFSRQTCSLSASHRLRTSDLTFPVNSLAYVVVFQTALASVAVVAVTGMAAVLSM